MINPVPMRTATLSAFLVLLLMPLAGLSQPDAPANLYLGELRSWLRENWYVGAFDDLGYNGARTQMFSYTNEENGQIHGIYTGFTQPAQAVTYLDPINAEHIIPQSFFGGISPMKSDLFNLQPAHGSANSARGNSMYGEVADATAQWYGISGSGDYVTQGAVPGNADLWSERSGDVWEPRESVKGDLARMAFYFYTAYPTEAGSLEGLADPDVLYSWHLNDPVDAAEATRNDRIETVQGNRNFFVDHPEWVYNAWFYEGVLVPGCMAPAACNYDPAANTDDGSCTYPPAGFDCDGNPTVSCTLFISEAAEGSSNNKYLEVFNPTPEPVALDGYGLAYVTNDPTVPGQFETWVDFPAGAVLEAGAAFVVAHPSADPAILAAADMTFGNLSNGDDGFGLVEGVPGDYTVVDVVGDWNADPGAGWDVAGVASATKDHTLVRKSTVATGNGGNWGASAGSDAADSEWVVLGMDDWTDLGQHTTDVACSGTSCPDENANGICDEDEVTTDPVAGCTYAAACNFNSAATDDDGSCEFTSCVVLGCTYPGAENFNSLATNDDGSCAFPEAMCLGDLNGDALIATSDLLVFLSLFGTSCP